MISVCMIAKNEEKNIERCLESLNSYDMEIVVVDTGSKDKTKEIATKYTDKIFDFLWCDDFSKARNFSIEKASNDNILVIDCDEIIQTFEIDNLEQIMNENPTQVGRVGLTNLLSMQGEKAQTEEKLSRLFNRKYFFYTGRIHEQIQSRKGESFGTYDAPIHILHTGYDLTDDEREKKSKRNIDLLEKELMLQLEKEGISDALNVNSMEWAAKSQNQEIPYIFFQLGKSYYMAKNYEKSAEYFGQGLCFDLNPKLEYVIDMVETYGYSLINSGQESKALQLLNVYEEFGHSADFQFLMGLIYMKNAMFFEAVEEFIKATKHKMCRMKGVNSFMAYYNIGVIYDCLGNKSLAKEFYLKCGNYELAKQNLSRI